MKNLSTPMWVVAVALLDDQERVLMQRRQAGRVHGGLWEFPGGKIEHGESPETGAIREIEEELGVRISAPALSPLNFASGELPDGTPLVILLYTCRRWDGELHCRDAHQFGWFIGKDLGALEMPPLDYPLAQSLIRHLGMK